MFDPVTDKTRSVIILNLQKSAYEEGRSFCGSLFFTSIVHIKTL